MGVAQGSAIITVGSGTVSQTVPVTVRSINSRISGRVTNVTTGAPVAGATVSATSGSTVVASTQTDAQGNYSLIVLNGHTYLFAATALGYARQETSLAVQLDQHTLDFALTPVITRLSGQVVNAVDVRPIAGVSVVAFLGSVSVAAASTDAAGNYALNLPAGATYQVAFVATGFIRGDFDITPLAAQQIFNVALSPILVQGQLRIVLTWGVDPADLDAHLFGPLPGSTSRFHVYWGHLIESPYAQLDHDERSGFGPETITITQLTPGQYTYSVHHYSGAGSIATSGALVRVFSGSQLVAQFTPPNQQGLTWNVFAYDGQTITPIQTMSSVAPSVAARPVVGLASYLTEAQRLIVEAAQKYRKNPPLP
jgi:hypothetical protein